VGKSKIEKRENCRERKNPGLKESGSWAYGRHKKGGRGEHNGKEARVLTEAIVGNRGESCKQKWRDGKGTRCKNIRRLRRQKGWYKSAGKKNMRGGREKGEEGGEEGAGGSGENRREDRKEFEELRGKGR